MFGYKWDILRSLSWDKQTNIKFHKACTCTTLLLLTQIKLELCLGSKKLFEID